MFAESVNQEWAEKLQSALDVQSQSHKTQIQTARIELEKAMELSNEKVSASTSSTCPGV